MWGVLSNAKGDLSLFNDIPPHEPPLQYPGCQKAFFAFVVKLQLPAAKPQSRSLQEKMSGSSG